MVYCIEQTLPVNDAAGAIDLSVLAGKLRDNINNLKSVEVHTFATAVAENDDKGALSYGALLDPTKFDIMFSSWAGSGLYQESFGKLGNPLIAKRQKFKPMESLMYFMPKTVAGDIDVAVCLRQEDIDHLKVDEVLMKYGKYIG
jgi:hypothetical protein